MKNTQQKWLYGGGGVLIGILITVIFGSTMNSENLQGFLQVQRFAKPTNQDAFQFKRPSKIYLAYPGDGSTVFKYYNESTMCNVLSPGADPTTDPYCLTFTMSPISDPKISYLRLRVWDGSGKLYKDNNYLSTAGTAVSTWNPVTVPNGTYSWKITGYDSSNSVVADSSKYSFTLDTEHL